MLVIQTHLLKAFSLAHNASQSDKFDGATRNVFRAVAHQIWLSCGDSSTRPTEMIMEALNTAAYTPYAIQAKASGAATEPKTAQRTDK